MRQRIILEGVVQGVGFRPFVKNLADRLSLPGITFNTAGGLIIEIDSGDDEAATFVHALKTGAPGAALIESCSRERVPQNSVYEGFRIEPSAPRHAAFTLTSPDLAICADCIREIEHPADRRYQYPFTNCTHCGPRYSITLSTPYDRANTTMKSFPMCADCAAEYGNPANRRFHAEPVACPVCGPALSMPPTEIMALLERGQIVALKGLGGFQLTCDALNAEAVDRLRAGKRRSRKAFALMMRDVATVERYCVLTGSDHRLLNDRAAPIVLLPVRDRAAFPDGVSPGLREIGVMLPYTPLHRLLFSGSLSCLVMTSGNISEEPILTTNSEAAEKFPELADTVVTHDRDIFMRVDDSVARIFEGLPRILRRARGYAPGAIRLNRELPEVLATGAELKNTFCIVKGRYAIPSQHIGDLGNYETLQFFEETLDNLRNVYQARPGLIVHDLHPDYLSTRWAGTQPEPKLAVQHHHAHIASCMAENGVDGPVIGVSFDGTGLGSDGESWGGEFLICDYHRYRRWAHLRYVALPGGDRPAREGWRMASAHMYDAFGADFRQLDLPCWNAASQGSWRLIEKMIGKPSVRTSSCGRLFDAVAAMTGIAIESSYEGEAAMLLEAAATRGICSESYETDLDCDTFPWTIETRPMIRRIAEDVVAGRSPQDVSRSFHYSLARMTGSVCNKLRERSGVDKVCLSGGVFQNFTLLSGVVKILRRDGFEVILHSRVPPNDGGISLGQAAIGAAYLERHR